MLCSIDSFGVLYVTMNWLMHDVSLNRRWIGSRSCSTASILCYRSEISFRSILLRTIHD